MYKCILHTCLSPQMHIGVSTWMYRSTHTRVALYGCGIGIYVHIHTIYVSIHTRTFRSGYIHVCPHRRIRCTHVHAEPGIYRAKIYRCSHRCHPRDPREESGPDPAPERPPGVCQGVLRRVMACPCMLLRVLGSYVIACCVYCL